jgi:hypothetical protein
MPIKTFVKSDDEKGYWVPTIEHENGLWLVPEWIETPYPKMPKPTRIIRMDTLGHMDLGHHSGDKSLRLLALNDPIPKAVLDGLPLQQGQRYDVVEAPQLFVRR